MADPQQPSVQFQTRGGQNINIQQPQKGTPVNRSIPPSAHTRPAAPPQVPKDMDDEGRMIIRWTPLRSDETARLELTDCVFEGLPSVASRETDLTARQILGVLTEVLALRSELSAIKEKLKEKGIEL